MPEILRLYRDLISLRKQHPSLGNCRKDLTEIQFDEKAKWLRHETSDPSGGGALLVFNFSAAAQSIPVVAAARSWRLALWTGDAVYGGSPEPCPGNMLAAGSHAPLLLAGFEAAIFVT